MRIRINGQEHHIHGGGPDLTYADVVNLARMTGQPSVTWSAGQQGGILSPDQSVRLVQDMVFNAAHTGAA